MPDRHRGQLLGNLRRFHDEADKVPSFGSKFNTTMKAVSISRQQVAEIALSSAIVLSFCSIAASQVLLGVALLMFLLLRPTVKWPTGMGWAAGFLGLTLLAALVSGEPGSALPQVRKLYLWTLLPLGATLLGERFPKSAFVWPALLAALASGLWSFWEYYSKWTAAQAAGQDFYLAYVAARITGFMSHWMTFGAHMMIGFSLAGAILLFTRQTLWRRIGLGVLLVVFAVAILLGQTRSIWLGVACSAAVLLVCWRPWAVAAIPVVAVLTYFVSPAPIKSRMESIVRPHGQVDSNEHRVVTRAVGWNMIVAHPLLGLGPEGPGKHFKEYLPEEWRVKPLPEGYYGHLHNVYLQYGAERGVPALLCLIAFVAVNVRQWLARPSALRYFAIASLAGLASSGLFEHNLGDSEVLTLFLALFGIAAADEKGA
jgi:putative inorganic carbon (hco3(-)) transporter